jgi:hypothetical protein
MGKMETVNDKKNTYYKILNFFHYKKLIFECKLCIVEIYVTFQGNLKT